MKKRKEHLPEKRRQKEERREERREEKREGGNRLARARAILSEGGTVSRRRKR